MSTTRGNSLLPLLRAFVAGDQVFDASGLPPQAVERAIEAGLGPAMARVTRDAEPAWTGEQAEQALAADLTARVLAAEMDETLGAVLAALHAAGCAPVLLKGCATARLYYPEPHLRTMGDVDLLVPPGERVLAEEQLRGLGFIQRGPAPAAGYEHHHHSKPFWHAEREVWVEVHTRLYPPRSPLAEDPRFTLEQLDSRPAPIAVGGQTARTLGHEAQAIYTATRWAESLNLERGVWAVLDVALLLRAHGATLDWDLVCTRADRSWAATALRVLLTSLARWQLADVPPAVLRRLAASEPFTNRALLSALHWLATAFLVELRPLGAVLTRRRLRTAWSTLAAPAPPWRKVATLPAALVFPSD